MSAKGFDARVRETCKLIPEGKVSTYGEIARALKTKAYQTVGNALHKNPYAPVVPCHRVVNSDGKVGGFAHGTPAKIKLLESEGVEVRNGKIDMSKYLFRF